ncbi:MAG: hypothetical protein ACR2NB_05500 [Solirubrobacteraceae bacterium]
MTTLLEQGRTLQAADPLTFSCDVRTTSRRAMIRVGGELDFASVSEIRTARDGALRSSAPRVVVDLRELRFAAPGRT